MSSNRGDPAPSNIKRSPRSDSDDEKDSDFDDRSNKRAKYSWEDSPNDNNNDGESLNEDGPNRRAISTSSNNNRPNNTNPALRRWQSKQVAQSIVDNAINKVLGDLSNSSPVHVTLGLFTPQIIENEGVAVAIRQQGLQRRRYMATLAATADSNWDDSEGSTDTAATVDSESRFNQNKINSESKSDSETERLVRPEDLLNQAVSCAISSKGLASVSHD